jgi:electron transport complex protein RnfC
VKRIRLRRHGSFTGGIDLPDEKHLTLHAPIEAAAKPERLLVPLKPCGRSVAELIVQPGDRVGPGQCIARAPDNTSIDIYAPLGGKVGRTRQVDLADRDGFLPQVAVELTDLTEPESIGPTPKVFDWSAATARELRERIAAGGLTTFGRRTQPLTLWLERALKHKCTVLVANCMEIQPYVTANHSLLRLHGADVVGGLAILAKALEVKQCILAVDSRRTDEYRGLIQPTRAHDIQRVALHNKYPTGANHILVKVLTGKEVPVGGSSFDLNVAIVGASTSFAVYRWVAGQLPCTHRVTTVSGQHAPRRGNFWAPYGMACGQLLATQHEPRVHGGPMFGTSLSPSAVVSPASDALLALEAPDSTPASPCVRCGWCTDHCPARLNVAALNDAFELGDIAFADRAGALACVECGLCSYVCPARLPLSQRVRRLKRNLFQLRHRARKEKAS